MKISSKEIRQRAIDAYESGNGTQGEVAKMFGVDLSTFQRWLKCYRESGRNFPLPRGHNPAALNDAQMDKLKVLVERTPDVTLEQLRETMALSCSLVAVHSALKRLGYRYKKNAHGQRTRTL